jgi:hypothetical protein
MHSPLTRKLTGDLRRQFAQRVGRYGWKQTTSNSTSQDFRNFQTPATIRRAYSHSGN